MTERRVCAVLPAAGRGTRTGSDAAKTFLPIAKGVTVWSLLRDRIAPHVERIVLVLSPDGAAEPDNRSHTETVSGCEVDICVQPAPRGMGDAVFCAEAEWSAFDDVLVVWGDQLGLSATTIERVVARHRATPPASVTIALVETLRPYVRYDFDASGSGLLRVLQSREGDDCGERGLSDVGCFCMVTRGLGEAWRDHIRDGDDAVGRRTGELNFLPFLAYLSSVRGWRVERVPVEDPNERLGINTAAELELFRARFRRRPGD